MPSAGPTSKPFPARITCALFTASFVIPSFRQRLVSAWLGYCRTGGVPDDPIDGEGVFLLQQPHRGLRFGAKDPVDGAECLPKSD